MGRLSNNAICHICGDSIQPMLGEHEPPDDAYVALSGQWMWVQELDAAVFVLDPDCDMTVITLPNGQLALVTDDGNQPTLHMHKTCQEAMVRNECEPTSFWDEEDLRRE